MPYLSSFAPLPQNSLDPVPPDKAAAWYQARMRDFMFSRTGRERVYSNIPTAESFFDQWPGLAVDAAQIIPQSETARESLLYGLSYSDSESDTLSAAPVFTSLNGDPLSQDLGTSTDLLVPNAAPVQLPNGLWDSSHFTGSESSHPVTTLKNGKMSGTHSRVSGCVGCPVIPVRAPVQAVPLPPNPSSSPNPPSPAPVSVPRPNGGIVHAVPSPSPDYPDHVTIVDAPGGIGPVVQFENLTEAQAFWASQGYQVGMSGVGPAWGDASAIFQSSDSSSSGAFPWLAAAAIAGGLLLLKKKGRRR